jgi:hypothetical protein
MKTDIFTKTVLSVIALASVVLVGENFQASHTNVRAATAQEWQIKSVICHLRRNGVTISGAASWEEDGNRPTDSLNDAAGLAKRIQFLGSQGWEPVTVVPLSTHLWTDPQNGVRADSQHGFAENGATTELMYIFRHAN